MPTIRVDGVDPLIACRLLSLSLWRNYCQYLVGRDDRCCGGLAFASISELGAMRLLAKDGAATFAVALRTRRPIVCCLADAARTQRLQRPKLPQYQVESQLAKVLFF